MKPMDIQLSVRKSHDVSGAYHAKDKATGAMLSGIATGFRKDLEHRQSSVTQADRAQNNRIEEGEQSGGGQSASSSRDGNKRQKDDDERAKDPHKGQIVDITAGFLA